MELYKKLSSSSSSTSASSTTTSTSASVSTTLSTSTTASSSSQSAIPTVHIVPSSGTYNYHGCWTEPGGPRALSAAFFPSNTLTIQGCVAACSGYKYAGAEYSQECFCADTFTTGSVLAPDADCSMTCAGDQFQYCGGPNRLSVYINNGTTGSSSSSSSAS